jgi:hypothetical protein
VTTGVASLGRAAGVPVLAVCGEVTLAPATLASLGFSAAVAAGAGNGAGSGPADAVALATRRALESSAF